MLTISPINTASLEVLWFDVPEVASSKRLAATVAKFAGELGIAFTEVDPWTNPGSVVAHGVLVGPTVIVLADGEEIARLAGPRRRRHTERFFTRIARHRDQQEPILS